MEYYAEGRVKGEGMGSLATAATCLEAHISVLDEAISQ